MSIGIGPRSRAKLGANPKNVVILRENGGSHVVLAHLMHGSSKVTAGEWIQQGQALAQVGNSGRSPVPHLHMNLQPSSYLGTPTQAYGVISYLESDGAGAPIYHTAGIPERGSIVRSPRPDPKLRSSILGWLPGTYRFRLTGLKQHAAGTACLEFDFDEWGRFAMTQRGSSGRLAWIVRGDCLFLVENTAPAGSLLALVGIALSRLPFISEPEARWFDCVLTRPFRDPVSRWLRDFLEPLLGPETSSYHYRMVEQQRGLIVEAISELRQGPRALPLEIRAELSDRLGPAALTWKDHQGKAFLAERIEFVPRSVASREEPALVKTFAT